MSKLYKYLFLLWFGGSTYVAVEVLFRGHSHWTMLLLGGIVFVCIGLLNQVISWDLGFVQQILIGTMTVTILEFITGYIINIQLSWNIWDYTNMPYNLIGQICPQFIIAWIPLVIIAILTDDIIRWKFFKEDKPRYRLI